MSQAEYVAVCPVDEVPEGRGRAIEVEGVRIALFRDGERVYALFGQCPHAGGSMGHGWVEDGEAVCPLHRWHFRLASGRCTSVRGEALSTFPCEVRDGVVWVSL